MASLLMMNQPVVAKRLRLKSDWKVLFTNQRHFRTSQMNRTGRQFHPTPPPPHPPQEIDNRLIINGMTNDRVN